MLERRLIIEEIPTLLHLRDKSEGEFLFNSYPEGGFLIKTTIYEHKLLDGMAQKYQSPLRIIIAELLFKSSNTSQKIIVLLGNGPPLINLYNSRALA